MYLVAAFQVTDGIQAAMGGIYKGLKKTKFVMISNFIAYLVIGVSLGTYLGIVKNKINFIRMIIIVLTMLNIFKLLYIYFIN